MPFPWLAAAKVIPWANVIAAAPTIARGARDLWQRARHRDSAEAATGDAAARTPEARLAALEARVAELADEGAQRSELITRLAEQNELLVATVSRLKRMTLAALLIAVGALAAVAKQLFAG